jgi:uncharacterized protein
MTGREKPHFLGAINMRKDQVYLLLGVVAAIAGCSARASEERQGAAAPGELIVRVDQEAVRAFVAPDRQVHVAGMAKVSVAPNVADLWIGVNAARPTAIEAVAANTFSMNNLVDALKKRGITPSDIQTSRVSITPQYSQPAEAKPGVPPEATIPKVVGYEVINAVQVTTRDLNKIGELLDAALNAGSNQLQGLSFRVDDREIVKTMLRGKAFDDAKKKAELYAKQSGMVLGTVVQIAETDSGWAPAQFAPDAFGAAPAPSPAAPTMPVSPGEQEISLSVTVSYELKLPK